MIMMRKENYDDDDDDDDDIEKSRGLHTLAALPSDDDHDGQKYHDDCDYSENDDVSDNVNDNDNDTKMAKNKKINDIFTK